MLSGLLLSLFPALWIPAPHLQEAQEPAAAVQEAPSDAQGLTKILLEQKDDAEPELVRRLANLKTPEALDGLIRFYDAVSSRYMRRQALQSLALFDGIAALESRALQKLVDIATQASEPELRDSAVDELAGCNGGHPYLAAIVASAADDAVRERSMRHHVGSPKPEDIDWYLRIYRAGEGKEAKKKESKKDEGAAEVVYTPPLKALAFEGLAASRSIPELVEATDSKLVEVRRRALEELAARRDNAAEAVAEHLYDDRKERPNLRLLAAQMLLDFKGKKFAEKLFKDARKGEVPLELAFGIADLLAGVDDASLHSQVVKNLGEGQEQEQRFTLRIAVHVPDPKVDKALLELSKAKERLVAIDAVRAMGVRGNPVFVPRLEELLGDSSDASLLSAAVESMTLIQGSDPRWRARLAKLVSSEVEKVRNAALEALGKSRDPAQLDALVKALEDPSWTTRLVAAHAIETLHVEAGVGALCARIGKEEGRMLTDFADILWRLTAQPFRADGKQWMRWWEKEGAGFHFPSPEEFAKRQRERDQREEKQVTRSFRGVAVDSRFFGLRIVSHHVAFVVDVSLSMDEHLPGQEKMKSAPTRIEVARKELLICLDALEAGTHFNILPFAGSVAPWKEKAQECDEATVGEAKDFVQKLGTMSGTNIAAGLKQAFDDPSVDMIFFLSDGEPSVGETDPLAIREAVARWNEHRGVVIHTISIGDRFPLLQWLAEDSGGTYRTYP